MIRPLLAAALAAGALLAASPANAACVGTAQTVFVCVPSPVVSPDPITQCVYLLSDECENVSVPFYSLGWDGEVSCGGTAYGRLYPDNLAHLC